MVKLAEYGIITVDSFDDRLYETDLVQSIRFVFDNYSTPVDTTTNSLAKITANPSVADVLDRAADLIEEHGWTQRSYSDALGYCAVGAVKKYAETISLTHGNFAGIWSDAHIYLIQYMTKHEYFDSGFSVENWNDKPGRTKFEVIELLRQAAKEWQNDNGG